MIVLALNKLEASNGAFQIPNPQDATCLIFLHRNRIILNAYPFFNDIRLIIDKFDGIVTTTQNYNLLWLGSEMGAEFYSFDAILHFFLLVHALQVQAYCALVFVVYVYSAVSVI